MAKPSVKAAKSAATIPAAAAAETTTATATTAADAAVTTAAADAVTLGAAVGETGEKSTETTPAVDGTGELVEGDGVIGGEQGTDTETQEQGGDESTVSSGTVTLGEAGVTTDSPGDIDESETEETPVESYPPLIQVILGNLDSYIKAMAPNVPQTSASAARQQVSLYNTFKILFRMDIEHFRLAMSLMLKKFDENSEGVFSEMYSMRGFPDMPLTVAERNTFRRLVRLFTATANPSTRRAAVARVDLEVALRDLTDDAARTRLTAFYAE